MDTKLILLALCLLLVGCGSGDVQPVADLCDTPYANDALVDMPDSLAEQTAADSPTVWVCPFESDRDTNAYKAALYRVKAYVDQGTSIPSSVLCDATPRSCDEYHICYSLTEEEWVVEKKNCNQSIIDMDNLLGDYAMADSTGAMEAMMLFCEFVDGYVAEAAFDRLILLEQKYPQRFAQLRQARSKNWNEAFDEWKEIMSD